MTGAGDEVLPKSRGQDMEVVLARKTKKRKTYAKERAILTGQT